MLSKECVHKANILDRLLSLFFKELNDLLLSRHSSWPQGERFSLHPQKLNPEGEVTIEGAKVWQRWMKGTEESGTWLWWVCNGPKEGAEQKGDRDWAMRKTAATVQSVSISDAPGFAGRWVWRGPAVERGPKLSWYNLPNSSSSYQIPQASGCRVLRTKPWNSITRQIMDNTEQGAEVGIKCSNDFHFPRSLRNPLFSTVTYWKPP